MRAGKVWIKNTAMFSKSETTSSVIINANRTIAPIGKIKTARDYMRFKVSG